MNLASHLSASAQTGKGTLYILGNATDLLYRMASTGTYTYNPSGTTSTRPHAVTRAGTNTYSYDANGNMLMGDGRIMTYDNENRLSTVRKNGATTTFVYDGDGGRVKKTVTNGGTTTTTTYIGKLYVCEGTSCSRLIYAGSQRIALVPEPPSGRTASPSYFHPDHLGSTGVLTNAQGVAEEHNSYRPYGQLHTHTGTSDVAYKYTGQERDPSTGLYFYNARYYDPVLGRFISPDTIVESPLHPQTLNRYAYAGNNPVLYNDPTGHCFLICIGIGFLIGAVSAGIASDWDLGATLLGGAIGAFSGGVGAKAGGFVGAAVKSQYGAIAGGAAGGLAGGAAAGGTSALLYRAAGYNVNVGLAIGTGAAAGLAGGLVGVGAYELGLDKYAAAFAGAAAGGAVSSTIMGGDPGMGALYAVAAAGLALGGQYANYQYQKHLDAKTLPPAVSLTVDVVGKIWNLPNTALGLVAGGAGYAVGKIGYALGWYSHNPQIQFGHNGIEFLNNPFIAEDGALTLGNAISYSKEKPPSAPDAYGDPSVTYGRHEEAHTYQSQVLGPLFIPTYLLTGKPGHGSHPLEQAAQSYGRREGHWWPWRW